MNTTLQDIDISLFRGVLIDFDNTFYEYAPCHDKAMQAVYAWLRSRHELSYDAFLLRYKVSQKEVKGRTSSQAASHSRLLYFQNLLESLEGRTNVKDALIIETMYWDTFIRAIEIRSDIANFLMKCKENNIKICLVTDLTASVQFRKMSSTGVDKMVDFVVTSEEAGVEKPHENIFLLALNKLQLEKHEVLMIGDDIAKDIDGAKAIGIKTFLVKQ